MKQSESIKGLSRAVFGGVNIENGVYVVYKDGSYAKFTKDVSKDDAAFIGLAYDGHTFGVHLCGSKGVHQLIKESLETPADDLCVRDEWDALMEWDFVKHTHHIQELGTDIPLSEGEYLPLPANLMVMFHYQKDINAAIEHVGGKPIDFGSYVWSCLRYSAGGAWFAYGGSGFFGSSYMYGRYVAIPLSLWEPA